MSDTEPELTFDEKIVDNAKKTFSLRDRLQGIRHHETKVLLFLDLDAVVAYSEANAEHKLLTLKLAGNVDGEVEGENRERLAESQAALDKLREAMLQESLAVHMHSIPNIAVKVAQRAARKAYAVDGQIPQESFENYTQKLNALMLVDVIISITDSSGAKLKPTLEDIEDLETLLPSTQWDILNGAVRKLLYQDTVGEQATDEPGF